MCTEQDGNNRSDLIEWMFGDLSTEEEDNKLVKPIAQMLCFLPDAILGTFQKMFVTGDDITTGANGKGKFSIKYSPAVIFSGEVPAFDVNFFNPSNKEIQIIEKKKSNDSKEELASGNIINDVAETAAGKILAKLNYQGSTSEYDTKKQEIIQLIKEKGKEATTNENSNGWKSNFSYDSINLEMTYDWYTSVFNIYTVESQSSTSTKTIKSTARVLQNTIATFYNALRKIALVGLLSTLVYMGIRIVLGSTSAKDKAKYKSMLKDWLIALCILFTLHYIMSITVTIVENINEVLKTSTIAANGEDVMMTRLRNNIAKSKNWSSVIVEVVLYFILTVFTVIFTVQYFRRTIYLAFLTVIAPLITLTYPLDKIKDSKSQAFDMWIRDYMFFMLLQVVQLLIYYILVGSSLDLADKGNWIFAIVAISFLVPAEKIIKKMFGFEKSKSLGALTAGATGGLIMNAVNKLSRKRSCKKRQIITRLSRR